MSDSRIKVTQLTADASPTSDDLIVTVTDPAGTPASRKVTLANAITKASGLSDGQLSVVSSVITSDAIYLYPRLTINSSGAATANSTVLTALAATIQAYTTSTPKNIVVLFPDGDVYFNSQISFKVSANRTSGTEVTPIAEGKWPEFKSVGGTTFIYNGSSFNGAAWQFGHNGAIISTRLRMSNLRFVGTGVTLVQRTTVATAAIVAGATTLTVAAAGTASIGDAISIDFDAIAPGFWPITSTPWVASITNVVGSVITFSQAIPSSFPNASIGNVVTITKQNRAIQLMGANSSQAEFTYLVTFENMEFVNWFAGMAINDVTTMALKMPIFNYCMYGVELGANCDSIRFEQAAHLCQVLPRTGTVAIGSRNITSLAFTNDLKVGMSMGDYTAPMTSRSFPEHAIITSIVDSTTVQMSHASTLNGSRSFQPAMGFMVAQGIGNSPWYPREGGINDTLRNNADVLQIMNATINHLRGLYITDSSDNSSILVEDLYSENNQRLAIIANQYGNSSQGPYVFRRVILSGSDEFTGPMIELINGGGVNIELSDFQSGSTAQVPLYKGSGDSAGSITFIRNNIQTSYQNSLIPANYYWDGLKPDAGGSYFFRIATSQASGYMHTYSTTGAGAILKEVQCVDGINITMNHNCTYDGTTPYATSTLGKKFRIVAKSTGAFVLTMTAMFKKQDGTAIGAIAVAANGYRCVMDFIGDGTNYYLVGGTMAAGVPVFVA